MRFVTRNHTNGKIVLDSTTSSSPARTSREMVFIYRCATRFDVAPTMSPRAPLSRLDDSEESHARLNAADGVPEHLRDHLGVPDKEVFELKAKLNALQRTLESTETERVEALKVAASATARCDSFEERAAGRLDKARTRAETAERAAEDSERRADVGERTVAVLERRLEEVEALLEEFRRSAEDARFGLDEQVATNVSLEDDVTVLHARVRDLERGMPTLSSGTQTTDEDAAAAARASDQDKVLPDLRGISANAQRWLEELEAVGAPPSVDTVSGLLRRASARNHLTPPGMGICLAPPSAPKLGAAGYTKESAARAMSSIVDNDIIPAVETMFSRKLPLRLEIRALLESDVEPFVEWDISRRKGRLGEDDLFADDAPGASNAEFSDEPYPSSKRSLTSGIASTLSVMLGFSPSKTKPKTKKWAAAAKTTNDHAHGETRAALKHAAGIDGGLRKHVRSLVEKAARAPNDTMRTQLIEYVAEVVDSAVTDGTITADQANELQEENGLPTITRGGYGAESVYGDDESVYSDDESMYADTHITPPPWRSSDAQVGWDGDDPEWSVDAELGNR